MPRKTVLKQSKEKLLEMKAQLLSGIRSDLREGREGQADDGRDAYDVASEERDREINLLLTDRDRSKLQAIDDALERIDQGTYGICESCEEEIAAERLKAMPFTRLCVQCQTEQENEARKNRRADDGSVFRRIGSGDFEEDNS
ncbi:MAG: DnaK suppressor protein [Candidatus Binatota bacterium]|nr:DnaK suppressor protein [Candidatus Binatota bacterium]